MDEYPIHEHLEAYLDIETTGLSRDFDDITVVGIYIVGKSQKKCIQLVGDEVSDVAVAAALRGVDVIYTYNGSRFDIPFIDYRLGLNLTEVCQHHDLMYDCWRNNLFGGLKKVESQLGIERQLPDIGGYEAVRLWWKYVNEGDAAALAMLLRYNREDVVNLEILRDILLLHLDGVYRV